MARKNYKKNKNSKSGGRVSQVSESQYEEQASLLPESQNAIKEKPISLENDIPDSLDDLPPVADPTPITSGRTLEEIYPGINKNKMVIGGEERLVYFVNVGENINMVQSRILVKTCDNEIFSCNREFIDISKILKNMLADIEENGGDISSNIIPFSSDAVSFYTIAQFYTLYLPWNNLNEERKRVGNLPDDKNKQYEDLNNKLQEHENFILNFHKYMVYLRTMTHVANKYEFEEYLKFFTKAIANQIKGKTPKEVLDNFGCKREFNNLDYAVAKKELGVTDEVKKPEVIEERDPEPNAAEGEAMEND